ncbi:MAG: Trifunctional nucleotide phosphoesterase protein YfkN [Chlamydiia bacterium]|nr:Trifunctional nucleotide phosphoesterase protein YfkN [Chlamydiia bacterium]
MKKVVLFLSIFLCSVGSFAEISSTKFTILTFNDVYDIHPKPSGIGGFATLQTMLENERKLAKHHITTMNGDFLFPSVLSTFDKGKHRVELFNEMKVDLVVLGNHEFDFGPGVVKERIAESNFPWFGANVYDLEGNYFSGENQAYIVEADGVKVGFFGIVTTETPILSSTENSVLFCPLALTAKRLCSELKAKGADVIVALTHLFIAEDRQLAKEVPEIDVILGGHDHNPVVWYEHDTLIMKTGQNAYFLGRIDLHLETIKEKGEREVKVFPSWKILLNRKEDVDINIQAHIDRYDQYFDEEGSKPLCHIASSLDSRHTIVRTEESTMANLILDALKEQLNADVALMSGGIIRGDRFYEAGSSLSYKDLLKELAFDNDNILIEVTGKDILQALEVGVANTKDHAGKFLQVSGIEYFYNPNSIPGEKIIDVRINGSPLETKKKYRLATNTYNQSGGDGFFSLADGKILVNYDEAGKLIDTVIQYMQKNPNISKSIEGRIRSIDSVNTLHLKN